MEYCIAGNFQGVQFSQMGNLVTFRGSIFVDMHDHAVTYMYKCAYFMGLIFTDHESTVKIRPLEKFPLYGITESGGGGGGRQAE